MWGQLILGRGAGEPPIVFTCGSAAVLNPVRFYQESIQAAKLLKRRAVLLIGKNTPPENLSLDIVAVSYEQMTPNHY